ncbi:hypothetical protein FKM82_029975 [Ascaphus truei]
MAAIPMHMRRAEVLARMHRERRMSSLLPVGLLPLPPNMGRRGSAMACACPPAQLPVCPPTQLPPRGRQPSFPLVPTNPAPPTCLPPDAELACQSHAPQPPTSYERLVGKEAGSSSHLVKVSHPGSHSPTHSLTHPVTHPPSHSHPPRQSKLTHSLSHPPRQSLSHTPTHNTESPSNSVTHQVAQST